MVKAWSSETGADASLDHLTTFQPTFSCKNIAKYVCQLPRIRATKADEVTSAMQKNGSSFCFNILLNYMPKDVMHIFAGNAEIYYLQRVYGYSLLNSILSLCH